MDKGIYTVWPIQLCNPPETLRQRVKDYAYAHKLSVGKVVIEALEAFLSKPTKK